MKSSASRKLRKILEIRCNKLKMQKQKQKKSSSWIRWNFLYTVWHIPMQIAVTWCEWHAIIDACQRVELGIKSSVIWWLCWQLHQLGFDAVGQWVIKLPFSLSRRFAWNCRCVCWQRYSDFIVPLISLASLRYNLTYDTTFCFVYFSSVLFGKLTQTVEKWQIKEERAMEQGKLTISERFVIIIRAAVSALDLSERDSSSSKDYKALSSSHTQKICARWRHNAENYRVCL